MKLFFCCFRHFCAVFRSALHSVVDTSRIERTSDNMVSHTREILDSSASDQNDTVLLQVMSDSRDVRGHFHTICQTHSCDLSQSRVRFFRSSCSNNRANASFLRAADVGASFRQAVKALLQCRRIRLFLDGLSTLSNQLVKCRHSFSPPFSEFYNKQTRFGQGYHPNRISLAILQ